MIDHIKGNIVFVSSHPIQYQVPIFKKLAKKKKFYVIFKNKIKKSTILFDKEFNKKIVWGKNLQTGYKFISFDKYKSYTQNFLYIYRFFKKKKIKFLILSGWNSNFYRTIIIISKILNIKIVLRCENNLDNKRGFFKFIKIISLFLFFKIFYKFLAIGKKNLDMYLKCGVDPKKIYKTPYCVDENFFSEKKINKLKLNKIKKKIGVKQKKVFLFVGKLIERKGFEDLQNISILIKNNHKIYKKLIFLIIGTGEKLEKFKKFIKNNKIDNFKFLGFKNQKELIYYYKLSNFLILPSRYETWGLVVNEAMSLGTPCIVSNNCGCANDLVIKNKNGFVYKEGNYFNLFKIIKNTFSKNFEYDKMKKLTHKKIKKFTIDQTVEKILKIK